MSDQLSGRSGPQSSRANLGDTHELMTRENTDGVVHYGLTKAACGAVPTVQHDIDLVNLPRWVDCPACKSHCTRPPV